MTSTQASKTFIEVQFPIGPLSLESYKERRVSHGKVLTLGKWWGEKPLVLTRAIILGTVFPASEDPERWPDDLAIFLRCMTLDNAGMWKRKTDALPAKLCYPLATTTEKSELFQDPESWVRGADREQKLRLEKRVFYTMDFVEQREYCCRVEQIDGPPEESWAEINSYLGIKAKTLPELIEQLSMRRYGQRLKVGDAFCGTGAIPFEAAELGCDVYASDLNPVACLLTWGALNVVGGAEELRTKVLSEQRRIYDEVDAWIVENGFETSDEGWRAEAYLYCIEMTVPEWDNWAIPIAPSWVIVPKAQAWIELVPIEAEKRFVFKVRHGGAGYATANAGTKQGPDIVCPPSLMEIFRQQGRHQQMPRAIAYNRLIQNAGGLRPWGKEDFTARPDDILRDRLYCIRWRTPDWIDERGRERRGEFVYREPREHDLDAEKKVLDALSQTFSEWQSAGSIPNWRIEAGEKTDEPIRTRGWTYWHHLFTPRQLIAGAKYSCLIGETDGNVRAALSLNLGIYANYCSRLARWNSAAGKGSGATEKTYYNQALNTLYDFANRSWKSLEDALVSNFEPREVTCNRSLLLTDARSVKETCHIWVTDPPYADAVHYEELSEFFLAWYMPHLKASFPDWYTDSMRIQAVKGDDAPFRVAMAECYGNLAQNMPDDGMQVLMFTHKSTDVWEDLALIMWSAGLQVKQVWSVATETPGVGIRTGNFVQATYNMVLRKRTGDRVGFVDFITPQVNKRVKEVITRMRESQIDTGLARCGYTDTDYLLAAQAAAAEVVTGYATIDGVDLDAELRTTNNQRGRSALRTLMENAKRTATDFLLPPAMDRAIKKVNGGDAYQFWRQFCPEEKFLLKGLEGEAQGVLKLGAFQDLGRAYGLVDYESLLGPTRANDTRTSLPEELPRPEALRFDEVPSADRGLWPYTPTRHIYHALKLLHGGAEVERAVKHLVDCTDFWNLKATRLAAILAYLQETTAHVPHWAAYKDALTQLAIGVEHHRG
jgi:putative DNA methylase